jgi:hypothetical protein
MKYSTIIPPQCHYPRRRSRSIPEAKRRGQAAIGYFDDMSRRMSRHRLLRRHESSNEPPFAKHPRGAAVSAPRSSEAPASCFLLSAFGGRAVQLPARHAADMSQRHCDNILLSAFSSCSFVPLWLIYSSAFRPPSSVPGLPSSAPSSVSLPPLPHLPFHTNSLSISVFRNGEGRRSPETLTGGGVRSSVLCPVLSPRSPVSIPVLSPRSSVSIPVFCPVLGPRSSVLCPVLGLPPAYRPLHCGDEQQV